MASFVALANSQHDASSLFLSPAERSGRSVLLFLRFGSLRRNRSLRRESDFLQSFVDHSPFFVMKFADDRFQVLFVPGVDLCDEGFAAIGKPNQPNPPV